jgi:hypothetical protein
MEDAETCRLTIRADKPHTLPEKIIFPGHFTALHGQREASSRDKGFFVIPVRGRRKIKIVLRRGKAI